MDILLIFLAVFGLSFFIAYIYTAKQLKLSTQYLAETMLLYLAATESNIPEDIKLNDDQIHKENFIKFLSESRDWAFEYIENVQSGLKDFINAIEKDMKYFDKYGEVGSAYPHYDAMVRISEAYKELKKLLPEDSSDRR